MQTLYVSSTVNRTSTALPELTRVEITAPVVGDDGRTIPAGAIGTIVVVWSDGAAYDVEFLRPVEDLATIRADGLRPV